MALLQAAITAWVMTELARVEVPNTRVWRLVAFAFVLCLFTGLGWYVGQIEPDCLTAVAAIALYLLTFRFVALDGSRPIILVVIATVAIASHPAHLGVAAGLIAAVAFLRLTSVALPRLALPRPKVSLAVASFLFAIALVLQAHHELTGEYFVSKSGPVFAFARMLQDGLIKRDLDEVL